MILGKLTGRLTGGLVGTFIGSQDDQEFDNDTDAFIAASGATEGAALDAWVTQIKAAGLWSFIRAWPMRAGQNAGAGTVVHGIGGLNSANGSLNGSPLRQTEGIQFLNASTQRMDVAIPSFNARYSLGAAATMLTTGAGGSCVMGINGTSNADSAQVNDGTGSTVSGGHRQVATSTYVAPTAQAYTINVPVFIAQGWDGSNVRRTVNGATVTSASPAFGGAITPLRLNARGDTASPVGANKRIAFAYYMVGAGGTSAEHETIRSIYKATLGFGLGLP